MKRLDALNIKDVEHLRRQLRCGAGEWRRFSSTPERYYYETVKDIKGKSRPIAMPVGRFRTVIDNLARLLARVRTPDCLHGGIKRRSPKTNARRHIGKAAVMKFDLADFFPSVGPHMVYRLFCNRLGCIPDVASILTRLVTLHGGLPQGSPTSTAVANLVIMALAGRIQTLAEGHGSDYSQFVDDGAISGPAYLEKLRPLVDRIIRQEGLRASPKPKKRTTTYRHQEQTVTGIRVNNRIDVPRQMVRDVRAEIEQLGRRTDPARPSEKVIASLVGKIRHISTLNRGAGKSLRRRLRRATAMVVEE